MKPYLLFAGPIYYPGGGTSDYIGDFDTTEEAIAKAQALKPPYRSWYEVVEHATMKSIVSVSIDKIHWPNESDE